MENFQPKSSFLISSKEKQFLIANGFNWCPCCRLAQPLDKFHSLKAKYCRSCTLEKVRPWQIKNRDSINKRAVELRNQNKEKYREKEREYEAKNKEKIAIWEKEYREKNKDKIRETKRLYQNKNREKRAQNRRNWWAKAKHDPLRVLAKRVRDRTREMFRLKRTPKSLKTIEMLGCNWEELKIHIENLFTDGMSWERISEIHIDHIMPLSSAKNEEELIKLGHYTNLQPLWAFDNISKGDKL